MKDGSKCRDTHGTLHERRDDRLRIFRCERCKKPCMLTTLDNEDMKFCPVDSKPVDWKQVNRDERAGCAT